MTLQVEHSDATPSRPYRLYVLAVLSLVSFVNYMDRSLLSVMVEPIKAELHISDSQVGLLVGFSFAVFYATFGIPLARLADRSSRVRILSICIAAWSLMTAVTGMAQSFIHLVLARIGVGIGEAGCVPASHSVLSDYFPPTERAFAISVFQAGGVAGVTFGLAIAGLATQAFGWRLSFLLMGLPGLAVAALVWLTLREPARRAAAANQTAPIKPASLFEDIRALLAEPTYRHILFAVAIGNFAASGLGQWTPAFFMRVHELSIAQAGLWLGASSGVGGILGIVIGGGLSVKLVSKDRRWEVWLPAASSALALPLFLLTFFHPLTMLALIAKFLASFVGAFGSGVGLASIQSVTPPHRRAIAISLVMFAGAIIGLGAGPLMVGVISDLLTPTAGRFALRYALAFSTVFIVWSIIHFLLAGRTFRSVAAQN